MKCELKYVGHEYINSLKEIPTIRGLCVFIGLLLVWCVLGDIVMLLVVISSYLIFIILAYFEGVQYCKECRSTILGEKVE